jgi:hypothetical protein
VSQAHLAAGSCSARRFSGAGAELASALRGNVRVATIGFAASLALAPAAAASPAASDQTTAAALAARNAALRRELELAEGDAFYLLVDVDASVVQLMYKGATLRETPIVEAEIGEPRARRGREADSIDLYATWSGGALVPPRVDVREVVVPPPVGGDAESGDPDGSSGGAQGEFLEGEQAAGEDTEPEPEPEVEIPKLPEELYPVPPSYEIHFAEGLVVEVARAAAGDAENAQARPRPGFLERLARWARRFTLSRPQGERVRLRLVMGSKDADLLFRSLPPDVKLLIRPPAAASEFTSTQVE